MKASSLLLSLLLTGSSAFALIPPTGHAARAQCSSGITRNCGDTFIGSGKGKTFLSAADVVGER